ncbi:efflux RND transporter periplasmic adaptor subunit [Pontibacter qinzhouensis]|uniref:Efflux RND transporter periplasmic adaptor subunit n=1 Tax=Pontibacter qinzhouensis TaxID=2603253 RepID=A0A5C8JF59_9BACT|nr:efflux RND transporter periplasmic adaptor subunit [Pontibacter qinzhouensis]TXK36940.1 efflux RND transporter periplasmic adaptor subunit [Pontibacter qinzhouensis]
MKRINHIHLLFLLGLLLFSSCGKESEPAQESGEEQAEEQHEEHPQMVELTEEQYRVAGITLGKPEMRNLSNILTLTGRLDLPPQNMASVSAPLGGYVKNTELLEGMRVRKGQQIASIENPEFVTLQQEYLEAKSSLVYLEQEYQRQKELSREQVTSGKAFQKATAEYRAARSEVEALGERLKIIGIVPSSLREGKIRRILPLFAPLDGFVTYINANVGQFVNPTDVLFRIADTDHLHVELTVFEKDVAILKKGQKVRYSLPNEAVAQHQATIYLIGKEISPERTVRVHAHMDEEDKELIPGMYVQAQVALDGREVLSLPGEAVVQENGQDFLFLYTGQEKEGEAVMKKFRMVPIEKGAEVENFVQVALPADTDTANTNFVTKGAYSLLAKMRNSEEGGHGH